MCEEKELTKESKRKQIKCRGNGESGCAGIEVESTVKFQLGRGRLIQHTQVNHLLAYELFE
jgi:hypothetical protein